MRKIPTKNYFIALVISIATVALVFCLMKIYNGRNVKLDFLTEITEADLDYYIAENNDVLIYMTSGKTTKNIDKEFKKYLKNKEIKNSILYINLNDVSDKFENNFNKKYVLSSKIEIVDPIMVSIENGVLEDSISKIEEFDDIKHFIERSNVK